MKPQSASAPSELRKFVPGPLCPDDQIRNPMKRRTPWSAVLCIRPDVPGFRRVRITPHLRGLHHLDASMPHVGGTIHTVYQLAGASWKATVTLPAGLSGELVWRAHEYPLHAET